MINVQSGVITTVKEKWGRLGERYQLHSLVEVKIIAPLPKNRNDCTDLGRNSTFFITFLCCCI